MSNLNKLNLSITPSKNKSLLYHERLKNGDHNEILFVEKSFFKTDDPLVEIRNVIKLFNDIVLRQTNDIFYCVTLRYGITKIAADFKYQYKKFISYSKDHGFYPEIVKEFNDLRLSDLYGSITWKNALGRFSLPKTFFEDTVKLSASEKLLLILYKAFSNEPNKEPNWNGVGGVTGLSDIKAAKLLGWSRKTVGQHRQGLESKGFVSTYYFDGRYRKLRLYI